MIVLYSIPKYIVATAACMLKLEGDSIINDNKSQWVIIQFWGGKNEPEHCPPVVRVWSLKLQGLLALQWLLNITYPLAKRWRRSEWIVR